MELKVYWTDFAKIELQHIYEFLKTTATIIVAKNTINDITNEVNLLSNHPYLSKIEELLVDRSRVFRVLISMDYKVIYWVSTNKNQIEIWDVFNCKQNPVKIKRTK